MPTPVKKSRRPTSRPGFPAGIAPSPYFAALAYPKSYDDRKGVGTRTSPYRGRATLGLLPSVRAFALRARTAMVTSAALCGKAQRGDYVRRWVRRVTGGRGDLVEHRGMQYLSLALAGAAATRRSLLINIAYI